MPALLNNRSTWSVSCWATTSSRKRFICPSSDTSARCVVIRTSAGASFSARLAVSSMWSTLTSHAATEHPSAASWMTSSRPIPVPPPVTTASRPANESMRSTLAFEIRSALGGASVANMAREVRGVIAPGNGQPVRTETVVVPDPGPGEALVSVQACGVCHTDLHYREGGIGDDFPYLLGHEAAGTVDAVGPGVTAVAPGDFVILNWRAVCGRCRARSRG